MNKYRLLLSAFITSIFSIIPIKSMEEAGLDQQIDDQLVKGIWKHQGDESIAVKDTPYLICPANNEGVFLSFQDGSLSVKPTLDTHSFFCFSEILDVPFHYSIKSLTGNTVIKKGHQNWCMF